MADRMVTLHLQAANANLDWVRSNYRLHPAETDENFGVVCVSPESGTYAILVSEDAARRIEGVDGATGVFSNPKIETFGPPA